MPRLLLVHDDPRTVDRVLRHVAQRAPEWEVQVESTVADAWTAVEAWIPDAIVAAAHAPGLDGLELFARVQHAHPDIVRVAAGVDPEAERNLRALRLAHRAVSEPVDPPALFELLKRIVLLAELVQRPNVRALLGRIGTLPAVPSVYAKLSQRLEDPNVSIYELGQMVAADTTLAAQVLRIANGAFFGGQQRVTRLEAAAARLGTRLLRSLVLTAEVYGRFPISPFMAERIERLQEHASLVARFAAAVEPNAPWKDDAFTAGLLHDIGKVLLAAHLPDVHASIVHEAERTHRSEFEVELQRLGVHHGTLGACLLGMWGLPCVILQATHEHHDLFEKLPTPLTPVHAVALADRLAHAAANPEGASEPSRPWPPSILSDPRWAHWSALVAEAGAADATA